MEREGGREGEIEMILCFTSFEVAQINSNV